ncbi:MAG TPA: FAD/NAD(P)-binding protein [Steroidobacteraceae bacterium]|nr:FAD/NAD(P)-binding protein [Steroidobacteraceae bacterium]
MAHEIAIVGAGFSGTASAVALRREDPAARIRVFERSERFGPGLAYGTDSTLHLLNVPAAVLGLSAERPQGFEEWLDAHRGSPAPYQPRAHYGEYLAACLDGSAAPGHLERIRSQVVGIERADGAFRLRTADGRPYEAEAIVLATGHAQPSAGADLARDAATAARIFVAWRDSARIASLPPDATVLSIGSGLTMLDMALTALGERGVRRFIALSSRGLVPRAHAWTPGPAALGAELLRAIDAAPPGTRARLRAFRRFVRAHASELDWRDAITALRPHLPRLWHELPHDERRRFLRHVRSYWEVHRHRCAPEVASRIEAWHRAGRLEVIAGRIDGIAALEAGFSVRYRQRGSGVPRELRVDAVIDATPACSDVTRVSDPLVRSLIDAGLVRGDTLRLGIDVDAQGRPLDADGRPVEGLYYVGPWLRARDWEATAVAELRACAASTAQALLAGLRARCAR